MENTVITVSSRLFYFWELKIIKLEVSYKMNTNWIKVFIAAFLKFFGLLD